MNQPAPKFTLTRLDGTPVTLDSLQGHVVLLDFWGTWCGPCLAEMPQIVSLRRQFASNHDVIFLAVNSGWQGDTPDKVRTFVQQKHLDIPVALDPENATGQLKIDALPTLILIDRQGHIRMEETGYDDGEPLETELTTQIEALLKPAS
jgi:thiol-disulfide isomerase/thioredoxin